jgi:hypothetical protein
MYIDISRFEWDSDKARRNSVKHGVGFKEAASAFDDPDYFVTGDPLHSQAEERHWLIGKSMTLRVLVIAFTVRSGPSIRLISARPAGPQEKMIYEENLGFPF